MSFQSIGTIRESSINYLDAIDHFCSEKDGRPQTVRADLAAILLTMVRLQLACLSVIVKDSAGESHVSIHESYPESITTDTRPSEAEMRRRIKEKLVASGIDLVDVDDGFLRYFRVETSDDLISCIGLHLSEIYGEACKIIKIGTELITNSGREPRGAFHFQLLHIARNHIPFILYPLEWSCDPDNWKT